jgi:hypothetical protein
MPRELTDQQKLVMGALQQCDIASSILNALSFTDDMNKGNAAFNALKSDIETSFADVSFLNNKCLLSGYHIVQNALNEFRTYYPQLLTITKNATLYGRQGWNYAASMTGLQAKVYSQRTLCDMNAAIIYDIPESIAKEKAREWYLSAYTPANPSEGLIIEQYTRGNMSLADATFFLGIKGVPANMAMYLYDSYEKYPSVRELAVASQFMEITDATLLDYMKYSGITKASNKQFYLDYMHGVQLRTELNAYLTQLKADYNAGLLSEADFISELMAHKPNIKEQAQILLNANHQRTRTLINQEVQTRTWFYRKGLYGEMATTGEAEIAFYNALVAINMEALFANSLVRFEAAKLGYAFEYEP